LISGPFQEVFAGALSCGVTEAISLVSFSSTSPPPFSNVPMTLLKAAKAAAPSPFFEQCETLRAITAGRKARPAALLVGLTLIGSWRKRSRLPRP
jgi:hypothetical protein